MKKILSLSVLILFLTGCRETARVLTVSESNAAILINLEIAEEKLEESKQAYADALASLGEKREEAYSIGFYDGCISLYLMMEEDEFLPMAEVEMDRVDEEIRALCAEAMSISPQFWAELGEDGSYFGFPLSE